jgi:hypothetical protein
MTIHFACWEHDNFVKRELEKCTKAFLGDGFVTTDFLVGLNNAAPKETKYVVIEKDSKAVIGYGSSKPKAIIDAKDRVKRYKTETDKTIRPFIESFIDARKKQDANFYA